MKKSHYALNITCCLVAHKWLCLINSLRVYKQLKLVYRNPGNCLPD